MKMKSIRLIIILIFILLSMPIAQAQTLYEKKYPNGNICARYYYDDNHNRTGKWSFYYEDGTLRKEVEYKNNTLNGKYIEYENDTIICSANYVNGKQHGAFIRYWYYDKNIPYIKGNFENGVMSGEWYFYDRNGGITGNYIDNKREGIWVKRHSNGNKIVEITYKNDKAFGPFTSYHYSNPNQIAETGAINGSFYDGLCSTYDKTGNLISQEDYSGKNKTCNITNLFDKELSRVTWSILPASYSK